MRYTGIRLPVGAVALALALVLALAACRPMPVLKEDLPASQPPPVVGSNLYSVDGEASRVRLRVYREGPMAALGHNHVIAIRQLHGSIQLPDDPVRSRVMLEFPVAGLDVDEPALRAAAGADFGTVVTDGARAGTLRNMLGEKLLDADHHAAVQLRSESFVADGEQYHGRFRLTVRGYERVVDLPLRLRREGDTLIASGEFSVLQSALGLTPFSIAMGALRVRDQIDVDFDVVARRVKL